MTEFFAAIAAFLLAHLIPSMPAVREGLVALLGRRFYLTLYSLLSVILLGWIVIAAQRAETVPLWGSAPWQWWVPLPVMPFAFWLVIGGLIQRNPLSVTFRASPPGSAPGSIVAVTRHPVLIGFFCWATSHIPPNGDLVALILFGGMAALAAGGTVLVDARVRRRLGNDEWLALAAKAPVIPLVGLLSGRAALRVDRELILATTLAIVTYVWFVYAGHELLIGRDPRAGL